MRISLFKSQIESPCTPMDVAYFVFSSSNIGVNAIIREIIMVRVYLTRRVALVTGLGRSEINTKVANEALPNFTANQPSM